MELVFIVIGLLTLIYLLFVIVEFDIGFKKIQKLADQREMHPHQLPRVSVILSALNEEEGIELALKLLATQDYPDYEIIAVNDRSTDNTPAILNRLQTRYANLKIIHIDHLPEHWLGKNHALHIASKQATGDWLLFTDADVLMKADTLSKTLSYAQEHGLDHLTLFEHHRRKRFTLKVALLGVYFAQSLHIKPWRVRHAWSKKSLGNGAFNLVKKSAYQHCNGHQSIAMECLDDMRLGRLLKKNGFKPDVVDGQDLVAREWYGSMEEMIGGLKKNSFSYYNYRLCPMLRDSSLALIFYICPILATLMFSGVIRDINMLNIGLMIYASAYVAKQYRLPEWYGLFYPVSMAILLYTVWNSAVSTHKNNGVVWRGTHYSLDMLR